MYCFVQIMFSVWRQVEEVMMTLQQDTEQHYKKVVMEHGC